MTAQCDVCGQAIASAGACVECRSFASEHFSALTQLSDAHLQAFARDGHVLLEGAIDRRAIAAVRRDIESALKAEWPREGAENWEPTDVYARAFVQIVNPALRSRQTGLLSLSPRIGHIAAQLLGVERVRLYSEDWMVKLPGSGYTPWHQDFAIAPFDTQGFVTAWIPVDDLEPNSGLLHFALGSHRDGLFPHDTMSDAFHAALASYIESHGYPVHSLPALRAGDISFHHGLTIHTADPNHSSKPRVVLALHMFADGAVVRAPANAWMQHALNDLGPGLQPGQPAASRCWRLVYPSEQAP